MMKSKKKKSKRKKNNNNKRKRKKKKLFSSEKLQPNLRSKKLNTLPTSFLFQFVDIEKKKWYMKG